MTSDSFSSVMAILGHAATTSDTVSPTMEKDTYASSLLGNFTLASSAAGGVGGHPPPPPAVPSLTQGTPDNPSYRTILDNLTVYYPDLLNYINLTNWTDLPFLLEGSDAGLAGGGVGGGGGGASDLPSNATIPSDETILYDVPTGIVVLLSIFYGSISLVAVVGNALVMWIVATSRKMHSVTNYFIANLALADIIIGLFAIPFQFQAALLQRWNLPHFMCAFCPFFQTVSVNVSIFTLTAIAVDRYRAIVHPLSARPSKFRSKVVIASIWLFSTTLAIPNAIALRVIYVVDAATGKSKPYCSPVNIDTVVMWAYSHVMVGLQFFVPLGIISFAYIRMGWELWGAQTPGNAEDARDAHVLKNKKRVIKMLFMVVALFAFCWAPLQTYHVLQEIYPDINKYRFINIIWFCCHWLAMGNSCCNPFIYAIYNEKFKREFRLKFRWFFKDVGTTEMSDFERSRYQISFRNPADRQVSSDHRFSRTDATMLNGSTRSSVRSTQSTMIRTSSASHGRSSNGSSPGDLTGTNVGHPYQEVHVCVPLKSHSHLHPEIYRTKMSGDTRM
ncbi:substance-K receptor-like isoform X2 [Penaeus japonicus]|uniref:substance-K receptor-like isoform X2 n=1 Tax=Penaeus japonicus TaxID=27405 RepID=UPI001C70F94E|nr:substance-K receptor-like isoform X2 [Penaeus japonicus]